MGETLFFSMTQQSQVTLPSIHTAPDSIDGRLPWTRIDTASLLLLVAGAVLAVARFWQPGVASEADMLMGVYRVFELDHAWQYGVIFPRLGPNLNFGYGSPLFQFYPPLASYVALFFRHAGMGWIESAKAVFSIGLVLAGAGTYVYGRWLFCSRRAGFIAAAAYLFAPYLLTNVYERGAAAEVLALGLVPWVFWALHRALLQPNRNHVIIGAVCVALLMLAHNITTLFVLPAILAYLLLIAWRGNSLPQVATVAAAVTLGLGLTAFYWLPALSEIRFAQVESSMLSGPLSASQNLTPLRELVQHTLVADYWGGERFHLALWQALVAGAAIICLPGQSPQRRFVLVIFACLALLALAMQLAIASAFWEAFPLVRFIQFPWRLLGLVSFCVAMLAGSLFLLHPLKDKLGAAMAAALILLILPASLLRLNPDLSPIWSNVTDDRIGTADLFERSLFGFALSSDYNPIWLQVPSAQLAQARPADLAVNESMPDMAQIEVLAEGLTWVELQVQSASAQPIRLHRLYFPGWQGRIDDEPVTAYPSGPLGLVTVDIPTGTHRVEFRFDGTAVRRIAAGITTASFVVLAWLVLRSRLRKFAALFAAIMIVALVVALVFLKTQDAPVHLPTRYNANFQNEVSLLGFQLPKTRLAPGETIPLRLYWLANKTPSSDYKVFLHLVPLNDQGKVAQSDSYPVLGYGPSTWWEPGEVIADQQQLHLGEEVPEGRYLLLMGLYPVDGAQNLSVLQAPEVLPGDRLVLTEIEVIDE